MNQSHLTAGQVLIRWGLQRGTVVIPKSATPHRILSNFEAATVDRFELSEVSQSVSLSVSPSVRHSLMHTSTLASSMQPPGVQRN